MCSAFQGARLQSKPVIDIFERKEKKEEKEEALSLLWELVGVDFFQFAANYITFQDSGIMGSIYYWKERGSGI